MRCDSQTTCIQIYPDLESAGIQGRALQWRMLNTSEIAVLSLLRRMLQGFGARGPKKAVV